MNYVWPHECALKAAIREVDAIFDANEPVIVALRMPQSTIDALRKHIARLDRDIEIVPAGSAPFAAIRLHVDPFAAEPIPMTADEERAWLAQKL